MGNDFAIISGVCVKAHLIQLCPDSEPSAKVLLALPSPGLVTFGLFQQLLAEPWSGAS